MKRKEPDAASAADSPPPEKRHKSHETLIEQRPVLFAGDAPECQAARAKWGRAALPEDWAAKDLVFQLLDADYAVVAARPVLRLFGITPAGHSVLAHVHDFRPYFYVAIPTALKTKAPAFAAALNERLEPLRDKRDESSEDAVVDVTLIEKQSVMGFCGDAVMPFFKVTCSIPSWVSKARGILEDGLEVGDEKITFLTYESNTVFVLRFMIDQGLAGCQWAKVPAGAFTQTPLEDRVGTCQAEVSFPYTALIPLPVDAEEWSGLAPTRTLSWDIEAAGRPGIFPDPAIDPVIQISNIVSIQGQAQPIIKNILVLGTCSPILGADVRCYATEAELLLAWRDLVVETDPDVITGFNILNFDMYYMLERAAALGLKEFPYFSRLRATPSKIKEATFQSNQTGKRESKEVVIAGRIVVDMMQVIQKEQKLSSYSLNSVSAHFLGDQKEDIHHSLISVLHAGTKEDRRRLAVYCIKDAMLPQRLMDKLMTMVNYTEMARVTGVPFAYLLTRGQGIKVMTLIMKHARAKGFLIPTLSHKRQGGPDEGYEGATVIEPKRGYYDKPVATLDFASLYPSCMMAHNLCYTTLLKGRASDAAALGLTPDDYEVTPAGDWFVKPTKRKGLLPSILEGLLAARGNAKKLMAKEQDKFRAQVYNGRQLALKVTANSVYGFTGQSVGQLPALEISASVTAFGRQMINLTKETVEQEYTIAKGYTHDAEVIYGDTDSVMVIFGPSTVAECMALGREAAKRVTTKFIRPISLEFEKVYWPYLLISKKRYAGLFWTKTDKFDKLDAKGIESVRRDNCALVRRAIDASLKKILMDRNVPGAIDMVKALIRDLLQDRTDLSQLIITKQLKDDYSNKQPHAELAERMRQRDAATAPKLGDRVPYVIVRGDKKAKLFEKAEDPLYVMEHDVPVDTQYYLTNQLSKPLLRIFGAVMDNAQSLLTGEHTRSVVIHSGLAAASGKPAARPKGLLAFVKVKPTCLQCRAPLEKEEKVLCGHCGKDAPAVFGGIMGQLRTKEMEYARLWTQCQSCQGSYHQEVLCSAADCPIFYLRVKVKKDLERHRTTVARFEDLSW